MSMPVSQIGQQLAQSKISQAGRKPQRYDDNELVTMLDHLKANSATMVNGIVDNQRQDGYEYYYGLRPFSGDSNTSDYVSMEVFDSVEGMKAKLVKAFSSNRELVRFIPNTGEAVEPQALKTQLVNKLIHGSNGEGYRLLHDVFHDGLLSKLACVKRYYRERKVAVNKEFTDVPLTQLQAAAMRDEVLQIEIESTRWTNQAVPTRFGPAKYRVQVATGCIKVLEDRSSIQIDVIPPENVHLPSHVMDVSNPNELPAFALSYRKPKYQLIEDGFDPAIVKDLKVTSDNLGGLQQARGLIDGTQYLASNDQTEVPIDEGFFWLDMDSEPHGDEDGPATLWHIVKSDATIILKEQVSEIPVRMWTPFRISHKAIGLSMADVTMDIQAGTSALTRGILDNVHRVNAGIRIFNMGAIKNPRDVIDNPIGGIIDTDMPPDRVGSVAPQAPVSPASMALMEVLAGQKEMRTGDTRLGRGLNVQQVISHQNSSDMIAQLIEVGSDRPMMLARGFAELFWRPLMLDVYHLAVEHKITVPLVVNGQTIPVNAAQLPESDEMEIDVALTPDYGDQQARKLLTTHQLLSTDMQLAPLYGMQQRYALWSEVFHLMGMANWLANPKDPKVIQTLQLAQQKKDQMEQLQKGMLLKKMQLEERGVAAKETTAQGDVKLKKEGLDLDAAQGAAEQNLKEREFQWQRATDIADDHIEITQQRAAKIGD